ncbi:alpha/beta hydrolase [Ureibacillus sinduriensis]|uniref:Esterase n=1 Tax=Ureibacillus sinduriensis BLB-1 = JCM 15800 TaxID=1384057 RepID=A0A0A3II86_9BACL|nr:dienelactone hydrolase family protein [Ureibacillus sinduriensis]KGR74572.1 esterase [Ureibacillus sinduriensis BLB-1 = JCM 15800]
MKSPYTFKHIAPLNNSDELQPALFLFHGLGSNENDLLQLVQDFKGQCHIFSMRGPITHSPGFAFYTFEEEGKPIREVFDKMITFSQSFILEAIEQFNLDINKIFLIGFNQGAAVVETLTLTLGNLIKASVALSGYLPEFVMNEYKKAPLDRTKIFISHGEYDYDFPIQWAQSSKEYFKEIGVQVTFKTYPDGHGVTPENLGDMVGFIAENLADTDELN